MKNYIYLALCAFCVLESCSREDCALEPEKNGIVELEVAVPVSGMTKSLSEDGEADLKSLQVFVFDSSGSMLEGYSSGNDVSSLKVKTKLGTKYICTLANAPEIPGIKTMSELDTKISRLEDNIPGSYVMYGKVQETISEASAAVTVNISRLVAKISIKNIKNAFEVEHLRYSALELRRIYLINVAGDCTYSEAEEGSYSPSVWYNKRKCEGDGDLPSVLSSGELNNKIEYNGSYAVPHYFYCMPNASENDATHSESVWKPGVTRLVVEVAVDGVTYYYPINIPGIKRNHTYTISNLVITRLGSESPDIPIKTGDVSFSIYVQNWIQGFDTTVTI